MTSIRLTINSTNWAKLGHPNLNQPVSYPYMIYLHNGSRTAIFESGPLDINQGDVLKMQLNGAAYKTASGWLLCGVTSASGEQLKYDDTFAEISRFDKASSKIFTISEAEENMAQVAAEIGDHIATDEEVVRWYELMLAARDQL